MSPEPERDLAHEADMRELRKAQLEADCGGEMADGPADREAEQDLWEDEDLGDPDEYAFCHHCQDDGMDPDTDYLLPCPVCQGEQTP